MKIHDIAIIGGGFAAVYSAWRLARDGMSVALLEASDHLGGTMRSWDWRGFLVDPGTHNFDLRSSIGADFYSDILGNNMSESDQVDWGSTTDRTWTHGFEMPDFGKDDPSFCATALSELEALLSRAAPSEAQDFDGWMCEHFGSALAARLKPMVAKTIGHSSANLAVEARGALGMFARPKLGSDPEMIALKASDRFYDDRLGVSLATDDPRFLGRSVVRKFGYPRKGALRAFCTAAETRLKELGVSLYKNTRVEAIEAQSNGLILRTSAYPFRVGRAFWTLPDYNLVGLLGLNIDLRETALPVGGAFFAFEVHCDDILGPGYLHDFSPVRRPFRYNSCGVYSGQLRDDGTTFVMAEVPSNPKNLTSHLQKASAKQVWADMKEVGYVRTGADCIAFDFRGYPIGYTIPQIGWKGPMGLLQTLVRQFSERISTITFGHRGRHSFMVYYETALQHELKG